MLGIFLDSETNGLSTQRHRILDIAILLVDLATGEVQETFQSFIAQPLEVWEQSDQNSLAINGLTKNVTDAGKSEQEVAREILALFQKRNIARENSVFICQNPSFDRAFFTQCISTEEQEKRRWPYHWLDLASMYWARLLLEGGKTPWEVGFTKDKIAKAYSLSAEPTPHRALAGTRHLLACYEKVVGFPSAK